jgi:Skp family chaperone for outer membrane proteins
MKALFTFFILLLLFSSSVSAQSAQTEIMLLGCDHFQQIYKKDIPNTDVLTPQRQKEIAALVERIQKFQPDMIAIERLTEQQPKLDSIYTLFADNKLQLGTLADGRGEEYQLAFNIAKNLKLKKVHGVNAPGGTSQSILSNGDNIELYKEEGTQVRNMAKAQLAKIQDGSLSIGDYVLFLNQPEIIQKTHHLRYIMPSRVTNGKFTNPDAQVDTAFVNPKYIGAELTSIFKNRDYKIYSNIVTTQLKQQSKRILVVIGQAHIGSLQSIFRDDPAFKIVDATQYLK